MEANDISTDIPCDTSNFDPITSLNRTFLFNGDNKQFEVKDANGTTTARYY